MDATCEANGTVQYQVHCELLGRVCVNLERGTIPYQRLTSKRFTCILLLILMLLLNNTVVMCLSCYEHWQPCLPEVSTLLYWFCKQASKQACTHAHIHMCTHAHAHQHSWAALNAVLSYSI